MITKAEILLALFVILSLCTGSLQAGRIIYVDDDGPADFNNIQAAIDDANDGDTIIVADGTYTGFGNRDIDFLGKAITVQSKHGPENCIVDCEGSGPGFNFKAGVTVLSILNGFTITNGSGILCYHGSPTITNCVITNNSVGIYVIYSSPIITNCIISGNSGTSGGMYCHSYSNPTISNCVVIGNSAVTDGAGIRFGWEATFTITNCTITGNSAGTSCGGVVCIKPGTITNSIIWGNSDPQICGPTSTMDVTYCHVEGGYPGTGNMDIDPLLMLDGYHIQLSSPCVNSGDPTYSTLPGEKDIDGEDRIINNRIDIGADELNYEGPVITISPRKFDLFYGLCSPNPAPRILLINNSSGEGIINWIVTHNCDWINADPNSGSSTGEVNEVTLSIDAKGLDVGKYNCELTVSDQNAVNTPQYVTISLDVRRPVLSLTPNRFDFASPLGGPNPEAQILSIWNDDIGILNWQISEDCNWLSVWPTSGQSSGDVNEVTLSINAKDLDVGKYNCELTVSEPNAINSPQYITVNLDVRRPVIGITPTQFDFFCSKEEPVPEPKILSVWNDDIGMLHWQITEDCNWLEVWPAFGISSGDTNEVTVSVNAESLDYGQYSCILSVSDPDAANSPQYVAINLDVRRPVIGFDPKRFDFVSLLGGPNPETQVLSIWNDDIGVLKWELTENCDWLEVNPNSGSSTGEVDDVNVCVYISCLALGTHNCTLTISDSNALNTPQTVPVSLRVCDKMVYVPEDFSTIQDAIDHTLEGGTVIVSEGTYAGPGNRDIDFNGKAITVRSIDPNDPDIVAATIIDSNGTGANPHRGFHFHNGEDANSILSGLTITNGYEHYGGGIYCEGSKPTITNCTVISNAAYTGGGIYWESCCFAPEPPPPTTADGEQSFQKIMSDCELYGPTIINCTITNNTANTSSGSGGGIFCAGSMSIIKNCTINGNIAYNGGGIYCMRCCIPPPPPPPPGAVNEQSSSGGQLDCLLPGPIITNCTVTENIASNAGGAICSTFGSYPVIINNCILWGNAAPVGSEIGLFRDGSVVSKASVSYYNVKNPETTVFISNGCILSWGEGKIDSDPCFADPGYWADKNDPNIIVEPDDPNAIWIGGDYHLKSQAGRWDANSKSWVQDHVTSLCIDAGDPNSDWTAELWPHGKQINIGTYGGTPQASMSLSDAGNIADLDNDGFVGYTDLFVDKWLFEKLLLPEDLNRDGFVNFVDIAIFAVNYEPPPPPPPTQASNPNPADYATGVDLDADLSWTAGLGAISHYIYFGTSNPPPFVGIQTATTFDPGTMAYATKYYWQIDEAGLGGTTTGAVWNFTTMTPPPP